MIYTKNITLNIATFKDGHGLVVTQSESANKITVKNGSETLTFDDYVAFFEALKKGSQKEKPLTIAGLTIDSYNAIKKRALQVARETGKVVQFEIYGDTYTIDKDGKMTASDDAHVHVSDMDK